MSRRIHIIIAALTTVLTIVSGGTVNAASDISAKFDGVYDTSSEVVPWMSAAPSCQVPETGNVTIKNGLVASSIPGAPGAVRGFITAEGYLQASVVSVQGNAVPLHGRMDDDGLTAGAIDEKAGCAWLVKFATHTNAGGVP